MKNRYLYITIFCALLFNLFLASSCRHETKPKNQPVAEVKQSIETPTLLPPAPASKVDEKPVLLPPVGPSTAQPEPALQPAAPPDIATAPLATIPGTKAPGQQDTQGKVASLAAPEITVPAEAPKPAAPESVLYQPRLVTAQTNIEVILDASGSMSAPTGSTNQSKFDAARQALYDVVYSMGQQQQDFARNIAVRLFGSKFDISANSCDDTDLVAAMGEPNLDGVRSSLDKAKPKGSSPISFAISKAAEDFPIASSAERMIVLVVDGSDSCQQDPCAAAAKLQDSKAKTLINVVAFDISPEDQPKLECIAKAADGKFFLARNEAELRAALDEAINSTVPYTLKISAVSGGTPMPFNLIVYKAGTQEAVLRGESLGTKFLNLKAGTYDILVEYAGSPEGKKPSKILKGVEILATTRLEQTIDFDLAPLTITALNNEGIAVPARFKFLKAGTLDQMGIGETGNASKTFFLTPGQYDITGELIEAQPEPFNVLENNVDLKAGTGLEISLKFQKGVLTLRGVTTQNIPTPILFQAYKSGTEQIVASGAFPADGGSVSLAPGVYDLLVMGEDPTMASSPRTKISNVVMRPSEITDIVAKLEMGLLTISAVDGKGNRIPAEFIIHDAGTEAEIGRTSSPSGQPVTISIPPGIYDIIASSLKSILDPKPSVPVNSVSVTSQQPTEQVIPFVLGTLRLRGRNAKEQPVRTQFTVYRAATDEVVAKAPPSNDWMVFDLAPGVYDVLATNLSGTDQIQPMIWIRNVRVEDGKTLSQEAIFTAGKLKVIGRGPNNRIISCNFKIFKYGTDRELVNGVTGDDWEIFEIEPGKYYVEASYHDEDQSVTLKKWINIEIGENEVVELILRF